MSAGPAAAAGGPRDSRAIDSIGVVGAGTMGSGIAQLALAAGLRVWLHDADRAALSRGRERIAAGLGRWVEKGRLAGSERVRLLADLRLVESLDGLALDCGLVIEAIVEELEPKLSVFRSLDRLCPPDVLLATNTSSLSVSRIAQAVSRPGRVIGLHFFNPAPVMPLVEVVATELLAPDILDRAVALVRDLGKTPLVCRDAPGFVVNRVGRPFTREALRMLEAGSAGADEIDAAMEEAGYPTGPFRLIDLIGVDVDMAINEVLHEAFEGSLRFAPAEIERHMVAQGLLGRKVGRGFHDYAGASDAPTVRPASAPWDLTPDAIVERIELALINEAYRAVEEGVAGPDDVDLAMRLGAGHPAGPFERAGQLGLRRVVTRLHDLHLEQRAISGEQYEVAPLLWTVATV